MTVNVIYCIRFKKKLLLPLDPVDPVMFCVTDPFSLTRPPCNPDFLTPVNTDFKKNVYF